MRLDGLRIRGLEVLISVLSVSVPKQITLPPCVPCTRLMKGLHSTAQILRGSRLTEQRRRPESLEGGGTSPEGGSAPSHRPTARGQERGAPGEGGRHYPNAAAGPVPGPWMPGFRAEKASRRTRAPRLLTAASMVPARAPQQRARAGFCRLCRPRTRMRRALSQSPGRDAKAPRIDQVWL